MSTKKDSPPICEMAGTVVHGRGIGRMVGLPTAKVKVRMATKRPSDGVYLTEVTVRGRDYYGVTHIGPRPTVDSDRNISVETHILNFQTVIYGEEIELRLYRRLRGIRRFDSLPLLLEQVRDDCREARKWRGLGEPKTSLSMDAKSRLVFVNRQRITLSVKEFEVLYLLYSNPEESFTKKQIYETVWREPANGQFHAVENTVFQIRKRLRPLAGGREFIRTVTGYGYQYQGESSEDI